MLQDIETGFKPIVGSDPGDLLTDFAFLPDESALVVGKHGKVGWVPRNGTPRTIANLPTRHNGDLGLAGVAVAPDYATSHRIYTARPISSTDPGSGANGFLRLSSWLVNTDTAGTPISLTDERIVVQTGANSQYHAMTGVVAAADGTVWVSIGDSSDAGIVDSNALGAQNLDDLHGKLLHVNPDGTGVPTNPYYTAASPQSTRSLIYARGFRSPFRFSLDPASGRPVLGDVGWNTTEEIDIVNPGSNYGWPCWEGSAPTTGYRDLPQCAGSTTASPLWTYPHVGGSSVTGGLVYTGTAYPQQYRGRYFFGEYIDHQLFTLTYNARGELTGPPETGGFGNDIGAPVKLATMPSGGDIVFADINSAKLRRLVYAPGNNPPAAVITSSADPATRTVTFDARGSSDPNGDPLTFAWAFGDGTTGSGPQVTHTYAATPDNFTVTLTATDPLGATGTATATVYPGNHAPDLSLTPPREDQTFAVGDVITATASATDAEDGALPVSWSTVLVHCVTVTDCHNHFGETQTGPQFRLTFQGHAGDTHLEITAIATDSRGATTARTFVAKPRQRRVTILSNSPANFTIGDQSASSGLFTVGMTLPVIAPDAAVDGVATFDRWSDGSTDRVRQLVLPDADQTLSVTYLTPIDRRYAGDAALRTLIGTPTDVEQGDSTVRWRVFSKGRVYWSPSAGVHETHGSIMADYLAAGGHLSLGVPTTDELSTSDGKGRYNHFASNSSIYFTSATGAHFVRGAIRDTWAALGWERSVVGYPTTDEWGTPDGIGRANHFQTGSIYFTPATGAHEVRGLIRDKWASLGWERSVIGYPTTNEFGTPDGIGRANHFQTGSIYYTSSTGAHEVRGAIRDKWAALGWERSVIGYPTTDEWGTPDGVGRANHFQAGSIYFTPATGAHEVRGLIRDRWAALGWERSYLGYPTSDEFAITGGRRSNFQGGYITYNAATGQVTDHRY